MKGLKLSGLIDTGGHAESYTDSNLRIDALIVNPQQVSPPRYFHWRLTNQTSSEIEIDIDLKTGELLGVSVVFMRDAEIICLTRCSQTTFEKLPRGIPVFNVSPWEKILQSDPDDKEIHFFDIQGSCRFEIDDAHLHLILFQGDVSHQVITPDKSLVFAFNEADELCEVSFCGLTKEQLLPFRTRCRV